jgi:NADH:ubiquinone oxidoreductase subunit 5 (subunit L)/multisubunit Na+/H+ antiporter MnhA subunit
MVAVLAISGFPGFSGFYSKEFLIGQALESHNYGVYALTLVTAGLTSFYMLRAYILAFGGKDGKVFGLWGGTYRGVGTPHESPLTITIPLVILALFAIFAGYWFGFFGYVNPAAHVPVLPVGTLFASLDTWIGVALAIVGLVVAWVMYARVDAAKLHATVENNGFLRFLHRLLYNRYYLDDLYNAIVRYIILGIAALCQAFDAYVVDGIVNGVAFLVNRAGAGVRHVETGRVQSYMIGFFGGIAVLAVVVFALIVR